MDMMMSLELFSIFIIQINLNCSLKSFTTRYPISNTFVLINVGHDKIQIYKSYLSKKVLINE